MIDLQVIWADGDSAVMVHRTDIYAGYGYGMILFNLSGLDYVLDHAFISSLNSYLPGLGWSGVVSHVEAATGE